MRRFRVAARSRLGLAMERGLKRDISHILNQIAVAAAEDAEAGRHGAMIAEPEHYRSALRAAILHRCRATAEAYIGLTLRQIESVAGQAKDIRESTALRTTLEWLKTYAAEQVVDIVDTTKHRIRQALAEGEQGGLGNAGIAKLIRQKVGGEIGAARAHVIARTETHTAANYGSQEAAVATRLVIDRKSVV